MGHTVDSRSCVLAACFLAACSSGDSEGGSFSGGGLGGSGSTQADVPEGNTTATSVDDPSTTAAATSAPATGDTAPAPECGNEEVEAGEECDGDRGCDDTCTLTDEVTAFRITDITIRDPPLYSAGACDPQITNLANIAIRASLNGDVTTDPRAPGFGYLDLAPLIIFDPLRQTHPGGHLGLATGRCTADDISCDLWPDSNVSQAQYGNLVEGTCFEADPNELGDGQPVPPTVAPCFVAQSTSITLDFNPFPFQLQAVSVAGRFQGNPATAISNGLLRGFLLESSACDLENEIAMDFPVVGGNTMGQLLGGGPDSCGGCQEVDDTDVGPNGERGWWFYASFAAEAVPFQG